MYFEFLNEIKGIFSFSLETLKTLPYIRFIKKEWFNLFYLFAIKSLPIILITAIILGILMVIQTGSYFRLLQATGIIGWASALAIFREVGPVFIGIVYSGHVGAFNASEIGTMKITGQIETLLSFGIDPINFIVLPRIGTMLIILVGLTSLGELFSLIGGAISSYILFSVPILVFLSSISEGELLYDFLLGIFKSGIFGFLIGLISCYFGLKPRRSSEEIGICVNSSVVYCAVSILIVDLIFALIS